jgi:MFS family permease
LPERHGPVHHHDELHPGGVNLFGRKVTFLTGLTGFAVASAVGGASTSFVMLVTARACQGAFAALLAPAALGLLTTVLALLDERRDNVITQRTRLVNQLHARLRDLVPGGAPTDLNGGVAARLLTTVRPVGPIEAAAQAAGPRPGRRDPRR